jgi:predicted secreted Zn-dependent protease
MKKNFLFLLFFPPLILFAQKEGNYINWSAGRKLVWDDFMAQPDKQGDAAALTATHLGFSHSVVSGKVSYNIECRFDKNKSWGRVKNDWILKHEQGHFDIAEIFARKLHKAVFAYRFNRNSFQKDLDALYTGIVKEKEAFQQQYDDETDYSRNKVKQEEWVKKIEKMLEEFKVFAGYSQNNP